jgi:glutathione S-transferase
MIEFVDLATAKDHKGVRIVVQGVAPSPWSEAAKGLFRLAQIPLVAVRQMAGDKELTTWAGVDNSPVVFHGREPARTTFSQIAGLVARLAPDVVLPSDPIARADAMGLLEMIAGEDGLGWNGRLSMIHAGLTSNGTRGFPGPVAGYLAKRYGYTPQVAEGLKTRVTAQVAHLSNQLAGRDYFGGAQPNAVDVYAATFLTPLTRLTAADCPNATPMILAAFAASADEFGALVPAELLALRTKMFEHHLAWPIAI